MKGYIVNLTLALATVGESHEEARKRAAEMLAAMITDGGTERLMESATVVPDNALANQLRQCGATVCHFGLPK